MLLRRGVQPRLASIRLAKVEERARAVVVETIVKRETLPRPRASPDISMIPRVPVGEMHRIRRGGIDHREIGMIQTSNKACNSRLATPEALMRMGAAGLDSGIEALEGLSLQYRYIVYVLTLHGVGLSLITRFLSTLAV